MGGRKEAEWQCELDGGGAEAGGAHAAHVTYTSIRQDTSEGGAEAVGAHAAHATSYASIRQDTSEGMAEAVGAHATDEPKTKWRCSKNKFIYSMPSGLIVV